MGIQCVFLVGSVIGAHDFALSSPLKEKNLKSEDREFYNNYLKKYYPKVFIIREDFFSRMSSGQVASSLREIVDIFTYDPWFYMSNDEEQCNIGFYWEYILDQLSFFSEYIENAKVDDKTKEIYFEKQTLFEFEDFDYKDLFSSLFSEVDKSKKMSKPLKEVWDEGGIQVHHDFYALCFDYVVKMFNEGILYKDWSQAGWYQYELRKVFDKLIGTKHEAEYHEHIKTFKQLYDILRSKLGFDKNESDTDSVEDRIFDEFIEYLDF